MKQTHQLSRNKIKTNGAVFELQKRIDGFFFIREANCDYFFSTERIIIFSNTAIFLDNLHYFKFLFI